MNRKQFLTEITLGVAGVVVAREILLTNSTQPIKYQAINPNADIGRAIAQLVNNAEEIASIYITKGRIVACVDFVEHEFLFDTKGDMYRIFHVANNGENKLLSAIAYSMHMISLQEDKWYNFSQTNSTKPTVAIYEYDKEIR